MLRTSLAVVAGFIAWWAFVSLFNFGLHLVWPAYAAADTQAMLFDLPMKAARLAESSVASILSALVALSVAPRSRYAVPIYGALLLIMFLPIHVMIWAKFPIWYHLYFLSSLLLIPLLTQWIARGARKAAPAAAG
jgi:hypothetical protein